MFPLSTLYGFFVADLCCLCLDAYVLPRCVLLVSSCMMNDSEHQTSKTHESINFALSRQSILASETPVTVNT